MAGLTEKELQQLVSLVRTRLRYEARRPSKMINGVDLQQMKVRQLAEIADKLEKEMLSK